jgi:hypothetical protein
VISKSARPHTVLQDGGTGVNRQVDLTATGPISAMGSNAVPATGYEPPPAFFITWGFVDRYPHFRRGRALDHRDIDREQRAPIGWHVAVNEVATYV